MDDPTRISNSLRIINTFLDADGTICCGSERMLSESLRSSCSMTDDSFMDSGVKESATLMEVGIERLMSEGRPTVAIEVAKRMGILMPHSIVLAVTAGPVKLASQRNEKDKGHLDATRGMISLFLLDLGEPKK